MTFPHSGFDPERRFLNNEARRAIEAHNQPPHVLDQATREMKEKEHTGIELSGVELAYLKNMLFGRVTAIKNNLSALERSLRERAATNPSNTREELRELREELNFLEHNLAEKLFDEKKKEVGNEENL